jgi:hypothetical protein
MAHTPDKISFLEQSKRRISPEENKELISVQNPGKFEVSPVGCRLKDG